MTWPSIFQRLVVEEGWTVVENQQCLDFRHVVDNGIIQFRYQQAKDSDPRWLVRLVAGKKGAHNRSEHPSDIAKLMGRDIEDPFEAFYFISKDIDKAVHELKMLKLRHNTIEPLMIFPFVIPCLLIAVFSPATVREFIFRLIASWESGPVRYAVYGRPVAFK